MQVDCFVVFLEEEVAISLLVIGFQEFGVFLQDCIITFLRSLEFHELNVGLTDVAVVFSIIGVSSTGLLVFLQSLGEFT